MGLGIITMVGIAGAIAGSGFLAGRMWDFGEILGINDGNGDGSGLSYGLLGMLIMLIIIIVIVVIAFYFLFRRKKK